MASLLAAGSALILAAVGALHVLWALGPAREPRATVPEIDGRPAFRPSRGATFAVAVALALAALLVAVAGAWLPSPLPRSLIRILTYALGGVLVARAVGDFRRVGFFKRFRSGPFARLDSWVYSPLCLGLGTAILGVAHGGA